jgi:hypothetical protein
MSAYHMLGAIKYDPVATSGMSCGIRFACKSRIPEAVTTVQLAANLALLRKA